MDTARIWYTYFTKEVAAKARTDEMLQCLVLAVVHAAADFDMYGTGKLEPDCGDHAGSYEYFRELVDKLGIPSQAIVEVIDDCQPNDTQTNLTKCSTAAVSTDKHYNSLQASTS